MVTMTEEPTGYGQYCPISRAVEVLGERWTVLILRDLLLGNARFNELSRASPGLSRSLLSKRLRQLEQARRTDLLQLAAQIAQRSITIEANANPEGHLYGSVSADQIAEALRVDNFPIEVDNVKIEGPLKELGLYTIRLALGQDVDTEVKLWVVPTHVDEPVE